MLMPFVVDDLGAWLVSLLADAGRKKLTTWIFGDEQERALRQAGTAAIQAAAKELRPQDDEGAEHLAMVISQVFGTPIPNAPMLEQATLLEALQAGVSSQLAVMSDPELTGAGLSSAQTLGLSVEVLTETLTRRLVSEIIIRGAHGGPLEPLAGQLNHDATHLQGQQIMGIIGQLVSEVAELQARLEASQTQPGASRPVVTVSQVQAESVSLTVDSSTAQPDERLQRLLDASDTRTRRRLHVLGLTEDRLNNVISWMRARPLPVEVAALTPGSLLVLVGELGAGKSEIAEAWHREGIRAAADGQSPFPIWLSATAVAGRLLNELVEAQAGDPGLITSRGCDLVIDELDSLSDARTVNRVLDEAANFAATRANTRVIATVRPGYRGVVPSEQYRVPLLDIDDALALMGAAGNDQWIYRKLPSEMWKSIRTPLYVLLTGSQLGDPPAPYCRASLLHHLAEHIIDTAVRCTGVPVDREAISAAFRRIAVAAITGTTERVLDLGLSEALLDSRLVSEDDHGRPRFALPVVEQYFAARALAQHEVDIDTIIADLAMVTRWRYSMAMMLATSSATEATELMDPMARAHPGVAGWLVEEAIAISGAAIIRGEVPNPSSPTLPSDSALLAAGAALRTATEAWEEGLGNLGREIAPTGEGGQLRPLGVGSDRPDSLATAWAPEGTSFPEVFLLSTASILGHAAPWSLFNDPTWAPWRFGVLPDSAAWAWRWSHEELRGALQQAFAHRRLNVRAGGMLAAERDWHLARTILKRRGMGHEPLDPAAVRDAVNSIRDQLNSAPNRPFVRLNGANQLFRRTDLDHLAARCCELSTSKQMLCRPAPEPDRRQPGGSWVWNLYSPDRLLELVQVVLREALIGYAQLANDHFPRFGPTLGIAALGRPAVQGCLILADTPGLDGAPTLQYLLTSADPDAVGDPTTSQQDPPAPLVDINLSSTDGQPSFQLNELARQSGTRKISQGILGTSYGNPRSAWTTLRVYGDTPATLLAYEWLNQDLAALNWMKKQRFSD